MLIYRRDQCGAATSAVESGVCFCDGVRPKKATGGESPDSIAPAGRDKARMQGLVKEHNVEGEVVF